MKLTKKQLEKLQEGGFTKTNNLKDLKEEMEVKFYANLKCYRTGGGREYDIPKFKKCLLEGYIYKMIMIDERLISFEFSSSGWIRDREDEILEAINSTGVYYKKKK